MKRLSWLTKKRKKYFLDRVNKIIENRLFKPISLTIIVVFLSFKIYQYFGYFLLNNKTIANHRDKISKSIKISLSGSALNFDFEDEQIIDHEIKNGDTLLKILADVGAQEQDVFAILNALKKMDSESIQLMVTSPPYYNAREYSQWKDIHEYLDDMREIIKETHRVLDNHRVWVFNVGDIFSNPNTKTTSVWGKTRIPLGAYFTTMFEEEGFTFVDDFIWDKGEVQSQRNKNASTPYPLYQYPLNCYEHILVFHKHRLDLTRFPCPRCGSLMVNGNTQSEPGLQSWECKNLKCFERSESNRGKRFSLKTNITQSLKNQGDENKIDVDLARKWRRDIIKFSPVIKINSKGENTVGHTAPFPEDIPEMAIKMFTYVGEKVLDPFGGSFTTPKVAAQLNRIGIGVELNKKDFKKAIIQNISSNSNDLFKQNVYYEEFDLSKEKKLNKQL